MVFCAMCVLQQLIEWIRFVCLIMFEIYWWVASTICIHSKEVMWEALNRYIILWRLLHMAQFQILQLVLVPYDSGSYVNMSWNQIQLFEAREFIIVTMRERKTSNGLVCRQWSKHPSQRSQSTMLLLSIRKYCHFTYTWWLQKQLGGYQKQIDSYDRAHHMALSTFVM